MDPAYGTYEMASPFDPDPFVVNVTAGGEVRVYENIEGCTGHVAMAPDVRFNFVAGTGLPLTFAAVSETDQDVTLLINGPDGSWYCNDDSGGTLNSGLTFNNPQSGQYDVWVGTFDEGASFPTVVGVTETVTDGSAPQAEYSMGTWIGDAPVTNAGPLAGAAELWAGFEPDPYRVQVMAGGEMEASQWGENCVGYIPGQPHFELAYNAGTDFPLILSVNSMSDTTLLVQAPNGMTYCDDDSGNGGLNPSLSFSAPMTGVYYIYVGTYGGDIQPGTLNISELYSE